MRRSQKASVIFLRKPLAIPCKTRYTMVIAISRHFSFERMNSMLKKFEVTNYKNFKDTICIDLKKTAGYQFNSKCVTNGLISKMLIYGRNATGKTNLGKAVMDICSVFGNRPRFMNDRDYLNADSIAETADFSYQFQFDDTEVIYQYSRLSTLKMSSEKLIIDGKMIFSCDYIQNNYAFEGLKYVNAETANVERYMQSMEQRGESADIEAVEIPFLRWLVNNVAVDNDSPLVKLSAYVRGMAMITAIDAMGFWPRAMNEGFYKSMEDREKLKALEEFLNFMGIECELVLEKLPDGKKELYFKHEKLVPFFETASSGTLVLVDLYRRLISLMEKATFIYLDEFDAFYHYEMAENVVNYFTNKYPKCQIIMTSHNTNLMTNRLMRPDCLFILSGSGTLTALCDATERELREGHNLEKMYISGEFEQYE